MSALVRLQSLEALRKSFKLFTRQNNLVRSIGTSPKKNETSITNINASEPPKKIWVSYGFDYSDENVDKHGMHSLFFLTITLCFCGISTLLMYRPDTNLRHWAQREAYLELRRREQLGLPLIDPNVVDPALVNLPTDEELGYMEIVI